MAAADLPANFREPGHDAIAAAFYRGRPSSGTPTSSHLRLAARLAQAGDGGAARKAFEAVLGNAPTAAQKKAADIGLQKLA